VPVAPPAPVVPPAPAITEVNFTSSPTGNTLIVKGSGFGDEQGKSNISFGLAVAQEYQQWTDTLIEVKIPEGLTEQVELVLTTAAGTSNKVLIDLTAAEAAPSP
jgi:hypothetical protein